MTEGPLPVAGLFPQALATQVVSVAAERTPPREIRLSAPSHGVLENNLSRKGIWSTDNHKGVGPHQETIVFEADDIVGKLVMESSMGRLSTFEMEIVSWALARWLSQESPEDPTIYFTLYDLAKDFGVTWGGSRAECLKDALRRLSKVHFDAEVWSEAKGELTTELFGIFERVTIVERRGRRSAAPERATVRARLNSFIHQQLQSGHFHRYSWHVLRGALHAPVAKRLYVLIDGQRGYPTANDKVRQYELTLDERLLNTLRIRDRNMSRVRDLLRKAGKEIVEADGRYLACNLREGKSGWVLHVLRQA